MQEKAVQCIHEQLTGTGFAVVDSGVAYQLAPHLWASPLNCGMDFSLDRKALRHVAERRGALLLQVMIDGRGPVPLLAMSEDDLARRVEWITGRRATAIRRLVEPGVAPAPAPAQAGAKDEPPNYSCEARREWFAVRGLKDPLAAERWPATSRAPMDVPRGR